MDDSTERVTVLPELIEQAGLTPHGLATKAAIPYVTLRRRLTNPADMRLAEARRIARALGITTGQLVASLDSNEADRPAAPHSAA